MKKIKYRDYTSKGRIKRIKIASYILASLLGLFIVFVLFLVYKDNQIGGKTIVYTVTLDKNGTNLNVDNLSCSTNRNSCSVTLPGFLKNGYETLGWANSKSSKVADYKADEKIKLSNNITLFAITRKKLAINVIGEDSSKEMSCYVYNDERSCEVILLDESLMKDNFRGYALTEDGDIKYLSGDKVILDNNLTLYEIVAKEISININDSDNNKLTCYIENGEKNCTVILPDGSNDGENIVGWSEKENASDIQYKNNETITVDNDINLYPVIKSDITYSFDANGSAISENEVTCTVYNNDKSCRIRLPEITREGWNIIGWSENKDSKTAKYEVGEYINVSKNKTLFAITSKNLKVDFYGYEDYLGSEECNIFNKEESCVVSTPEVYRTGYEILGWSTVKNSKKAEFVNGITLSKDISLYVITKKTITVNFVLTGTGSIDFESKQCDIYNEEGYCNILIPNVNRPGYISFGFNTTLNGSESFPSYVSNSYYSFSDSATLYADFNDKTFKYRAVSVHKGFAVDKIYFEIDSSCSEETAKKEINKVNANWKGLFKYGTKVMFLANDSYKSIHNDNSQGTTFGLSSSNGEPKKFVDLVCDTPGYVLVHELIHNYDFYYKSVYGKFLSQSKELTNLYDKYVLSDDRPMRDYSYSTYKEFLADMAMYYYMITFNNYEEDIPDDIKDFVRTYLFNI